MADHRAGVKAKNPGVHAREVTKQLDVMWKEMSTADKAPYAQQQKEDKKRYEAEMADYTPPVDNDDDNNDEEAAAAAAAAAVTKPTVAKGKGKAEAKAALAKTSASAVSTFALQTAPVPAPVPVGAQTDARTETGVGEEVVTRSGGQMRKPKAKTQMEVVEEKAKPAANGNEVSAHAKLPQPSPVESFGSKVCGKVKVTGLLVRVIGHHQ
jgi:hypothetical protein